MSSFWLLSSISWWSVIIDQFLEFELSHGRKSKSLFKKRYKAPSVNYVENYLLEHQLSWHLGQKLSRNSLTEFIFRVLYDFEIHCKHFLVDRLGGEAGTEKYIRDNCRAPFHGETISIVPLQFCEEDATFTDIFNWPRWLDHLHNNPCRIYHFSRK